MFDCVKKGLYDLFRNKLRLFLTVGGIAIGVISVLIISTIGDIGKITINKQLDNMGMDNLVITSEKSNVKGLWENDLEVIKNVPEIKNAMPLMNFYTKCSVRDTKFNCMAWGVNEDAKEVIEFVPIHGRLLNRGDVANASRVCIIDEKIALENYKRSNIVGKKIQLYANGSLQDFEVVGIVKNGVNALQSMMGEFIPSFVYVPYTTLEQDFSQYYFDQISVKLDEGASSEKAAEQIESAVLSGRDIPVEITVQNLVKQKSQLNKKEIVGEDEIAEIVSLWTGIPVKKLSEKESERLLTLEDSLHKRVIGQSEAVTAVSKAIRRSRVGLKDPKRPIGSFMFLGPTGVGKTELSKALAECLFDDENAMIRLDMSEFMEKHTVSKLIGSPPGYVGFDDGGQLTEKIRRKPYSVVLFDEIEKAHPDVFNILLQIFEDGILTDSHGKKVNFKNTVIILTSNIGARMITEKKSLGFTSSENEDDTKKAVLDELKKCFKPEFLNRIDDTIVFHRLSKEDINLIAKKLLDGLCARAMKLGIILSYTEEAVENLAAAGFDKNYGARPLRRVIISEVEDLLSQQLLEGEIKSGDVLTLRVCEGKYVLSQKIIQY